MTGLLLSVQSRAMVSPTSRDKTSACPARVVDVMEDRTAFMLLRRDLSSRFINRYSERKQEPARPPSGCSGRGQEWSAMPAAATR